MDFTLIAATEEVGQVLEGVFTAAPHNDVLKLLIEIVILLFTARVLDAEEVTVLNVIEWRYFEYRNTDNNWEKRQVEISEQMVGELRELGEALNVHTSTEIHRHKDTTDAILERAQQENIDLIVMGTNVRAGSERLYLGPKIERILTEAPCPVIVVNSN
jgi:nucleotide-binding universal stress UspA family protein